MKKMYSSNLDECMKLVYDVMHQKRNFQRANETVQEKEARNAKRRLKQKLKRANETVQEKEARNAKRRMKRKLKRENETVQQTEELLNTQTQLIRCYGCYFVDDAENLVECEHCLATVHDECGEWNEDEFLCGICFDVEYQTSDDESIYTPSVQSAYPPCKKRKLLYNNNY